MNPKEILLIRIDRLGDLILTLPAIHTVHLNFPQAKIDFLVNEQFADIVRNIPFIRKVYTIKPRSIFRALYLMHEIRKKTYDFVIDLNTSTNHLSSLLLFAAKSKRKAGYAVGIRKYIANIAMPPPSRITYERDMVLDILRWIKLKKIVTKVILPEIDDNNVREFLKTLNSNKIIGICPSASKTNKAWQPQKYGELIKKIAKYPCTIILIGSAENKELCAAINKTAENHAINTAGMFSPVQLCAIVGKLSLFVGNNSGPMHIAQACNTPAIIINGNSSITRWINKDIKTTVVINKDQSDYEAENSQSSRIQEITVDEVFNEVEKICTKWEE